MTGTGDVSTFTGSDSLIEDAGAGVREDKSSTGSADIGASTTRLDTATDADSSATNACNAPGNAGTTSARERSCDDMYIHTPYTSAAQTTAINIIAAPGVRPSGIGDGNTSRAFASNSAVSSLNLAAITSLSNPRYSEYARTNPTAYVCPGSSSLRPSSSASRCTFRIFKNPATSSRVRSARSRENLNCSATVRTTAGSLSRDTSFASDRLTSRACFKFNIHPTARKMRLFPPNDQKTKLPDTRPIIH